MSKSIIPINEGQIQRDIESIGIKTIELFDTSKLTINPLECALSLLPHLALALDVNIDGLDEDEQRTYLQNAREIKKYDGSVYAVRMAANSIFDDVKILQWFDYGGIPNRFKLDISVYTKEVSLDNIQKVRRLVEDSKRKSSHLDEIQLSYKIEQSLNISSGGIGEVSCNSEMVEGYESVSVGTQKINLGAVGEVSSYAVQM
ncbi:phage tail protein I [Poseidonibacter sp.]|uniref:phage tail protein I n=1 Tax=Poseidonibacter sp. TaxID=2321188 RepID=UPI003C721E6E